MPELETTSKVPHGYFSEEFGVEDERRLMSFSGSSPRLRLGVTL